LLHAQKISCRKSRGAKPTMKTSANAFVTLLVILAAAIGIASARPAPAPDHPYYMDALSDLRMARAYLERPGNNGTERNEDHAIDEIDAAIREIKHASIDDGKDIHDHPPIDANLAWTDRFHKSLELLDKTFSDCSKEEDDPAARGLQQRILGHIDAARHFVHRAMDDAGR
jgi:hypothetical protein